MASLQSSMCLQGVGLPITQRLSCAVAVLSAKCHCSKVHYAVLFAKPPPSP
jgi:hypothetical protein